MTKVEGSYGNLRIFPYEDGKILDITHADTNEHTATMPAGIPSNCVAMYVVPYRIGGTGQWAFRSVSGGNDDICNSNESVVWFRAANGNWYYRLTVANDDWDIYCWGYWVEG